MALTPEQRVTARTLRGLGVSESYAHEIAAGDRTPSRRLAIRIFRGAGLKLGPIAQVSDEDIAVLERLEALAA